MHEVSLVRYEEKASSVKNAIDLVKGFEGLNKDDKVLIKPNIVWGGGLMSGIPRYGFITTCQVIEEIVLALLEFGCRAENITIGEGSVVSDELKSTTTNGFKWSGMKRLGKMGVKFLDFNVKKFRTVEAEGIKMQIAEAIFDSDFVIDVPVLKTHFMTTVSLGMKNLKGCLSVPSKKRFHTSKKLKKNIAAMNVAFRDMGKPQLTVIDGIYSLECGPSPNGTASRSNLILAGKDIFSVDLIGTELMGVPVEDVEYFKDYAQMTDRTLDTSGIKVIGEKVEDHRMKYNYQVDYEEILKRKNITGLKMKDPGDTLCTGCVTKIEAAFLCYSADISDLQISKKMEICAASKIEPDEDSETVFLFGNCACRKNKELIKNPGDRNIIAVKGCTPMLTPFLHTLYKGTLPKGLFLKAFTKRVFKLMGTALKVYNEDTLKKDYNYPEFTTEHFM